MDHLPFAKLSPEYVSDLLRPCQQQWWIAGGWAIDGYLGSTTREHDDLDVAVLYKEEAELRRYLDSQGLEVWPGLSDGQSLDAPVYPDEQLPNGTKVLLCREPSKDWAFECLLQKTSGDEWIFLHDDRVRRPLNKIGFVGQDDIPYKNPEIVLLYKARQRLDKDEHDFGLVEPRLSKQARSWLASAIGIVYSDHPWLSRLER